jgi:hypothetical protein
MKHDEHRHMVSGISPDLAFRHALARCQFLVTSHPP